MTGAPPHDRSPAAPPGSAPSDAVLIAAALGALVAVGTAMLGMVLLSVVLMDSARYAVALVGGSLGAPVQLSLSDAFGGGLGVLFGTVDAEAFVRFPLTVAAAIPAAALVGGGWVAAQHLAGGRAIETSSAARAGALSGALFAVLLLFANALAGGAVQSRPLPTLVWGVVWGVPLGVMGALCRQTSWRPLAELAHMAAPLERLPVVSALPVVAGACVRIARSALGVLVVYIIAGLLVGAFERSVWLGGAMLVPVVLGGCGAWLAQRLGGAPQISFALLAAAGIAIVVVLSVPELRLFALAALALLPSLALAALYWAQGTAFEMGVASGSTDASFGHISFWSQVSDSWSITLLALPIMIAAAWQLFRAGRKIAGRQRAADVHAAVASGASVALLWTALMLLARPLASFSTGGSVVFGELTGHAGPSALSTLVSSLLFAGVFGSLGGVQAVRTEHAALGVPRLLRWTQRRARGPRTFAYLVADVVALARGASARPIPPGAAAATGPARSAAEAAAGNRSAMAAPLWWRPASEFASAAAVTAAGAEPAPAGPAGDTVRPAAAGWPATWFRWRRRHTVALGAVIALVAVGVLANRTVQAGKDRGAVVSSVEERLTELRHDGDISAMLAGDVLPLDESQEVTLRSFGEVSLGKLDDHEATATVPTVVTLRTQLPERYRDAAPREIEVRSVWKLLLLGDKDQRRWEVRTISRHGALRTSPAMLAAPSPSDVLAARAVAEQTVTDAFHYTATETPSHYNARQPDTYLTAPATQAQALELLQADPYGIDDLMTTVPPFVVEQPDAYGSETTLRGTAYEPATELVSQAADYCYGERAVRTIRARVDAWAPDMPESPPLGDLQRVSVYGTLHLSARMTCSTQEDFFSDRRTVRHETVSVDTPVHAVVVRPHLKGVDSHWRVQTIAVGEADSTTIYSAE